MALTMIKRLLCNIFCIIVYSALYISVNGEAKQSCTAGVTTAGYTYPPGDIIIEYGNSLEIFCVINREYENISISRNLSFISKSGPIPPQMVTIINDTTIRYYDPNPPKSNSMYTCQLNNETAVCLNKVAVAVKPQNVTNFGCLALNYENLTCSFDAPNNEIKTDYELMYMFKGRVQQSITCPKLHDENGKYTYFWNMSTDPQYRPAQRQYYFTLRMNNTFGERNLTYTFNHYANLLPGPPANLTSRNVTTNSIVLNWSPTPQMLSFDTDLWHRLLYQCEYDNKDEWKLAAGSPILKPPQENISFTIEGIEYADTLCDIRVSSKTKDAQGEVMWSKNGTITVRTASTIPGMAPRTNIGSFEETIVSGNEKDVIIFWQQIPSCLRNGENFEYKIKMLDNDKPPASPEVYSAYAKYTNLSRFKDYRFKIWSENSVGSSLRSSYVFVPKSKTKEPRSFTKTLFGPGKYELSWLEPECDGICEYTNYTIFSCINMKELPFQCKGNLTWEVIPFNRTAHNVTFDESLSPQFAISANTIHGSSGMSWAACTLIHNQSIGKMKNVLISNVSSTFIELGWKLDCSDQIKNVEGFIIYYCPIITPRDPTCLGPEKNHTIENATVERGRVNNLTPYTTYMLKVAVKTKHGSYSQPSDPCFKTTVEAAPSEPRNVTVVTVTNTTIVIEWIKPNQTNGIIKYYTISYNGVSVNATPKNQDELKIEIELTHLNSFVEHCISVVACTTSCSEASPLINVTTNSGLPDAPEQPTVGFQNVSIIEVKWQKPHIPRGRIDYYVVQFKQELQGYNITKFVNVTDTRYYIGDCGEGGKYESFYISIRAVNIWNKTHMESKWSPDLEYYCRSSTTYLYWMLIPILMAVVGLIFYLSKKLYYYCQDMRNVDIKLPPGLTSVSDHNWSHQKSQEELPHNTPGDEELLLIKMNGISSGDSSGCSSGHESVSSSIESGKSTSSADSGTEQPHITTSNEDFRNSSLRLRNNISPKTSPIEGYVTMPTDNIFNSGNYCILGVNPNQQPESDTNFLPVNAMMESTKLPYLEEGANKSIPYVLTGDVMKNNTMGGYVPHNFAKVAEKSPAYVMAGNKDSLMVETQPHYDVAEEKPIYVQVSDCNHIKLTNSPDKSSWTPENFNMDKTSATLGVIPMQLKANPGYVPHKHFESTTLNE